jgi:hypothetical protein
MRCDGGDRVQSARKEGRRRPDAGFTLVVVALRLLILTATAPIALHTTRTDLNAAGRLRESKYAFYAAEAGLAAGKEFLASRWDPVTRWTSVIPRTAPPPCAFVESGRINCCPAGSTACLQSDPFYRPFQSSTDPQLRALRTAYYVTFRNNCTPPNCLDNAADPLRDDDGRVIISATGFGPNGARVTLELQVAQSGQGSLITDYTAQQGGGAAKQARTPIDAQRAQLGSQRSF